MATIETPTPTVESPAPLMQALKTFFSAEKKFRGANRVLAVEVRAFAKSSSASPASIRQAIAEAISAAKGVKVEQVTNSSAKGGDGTLYTMLSNLSRIAFAGTSKKDATEEEKERDRLAGERVDQAIADETTSYDAIYKASAKKPVKQQTGNPTEGTASKDKSKSKVTLETLAHEVLPLVKSLAAQKVGKDELIEAFAAAVEVSVEGVYGDDEDAPEGDDQELED